MNPVSPDSVIDLSLVPTDAVAAHEASVERELLRQFDRCGPRLLGYVTSFGLNVEEAEDIVQEAFLALFRHLSLGRDQRNLTGWLFRVAHNLALKRRAVILRQHARETRDEAEWRHHLDPEPDPEIRLADQERQRRLRAVVNALSERDRRCVCLRAEGLSYREIGVALRVSLGAVARSLTRAMTRLTHADGEQ